MFRQGGLYLCNLCLHILKGRCRDKKRGQGISGIHGVLRCGESLLSHKDRGKPLRLAVKSLKYSNRNKNNVVFI